MREMEENQRRGWEERENLSKALEAERQKNVAVSVSRWIVCSCVKEGVKEGV